MKLQMDYAALDERYSHALIRFSRWLVPYLAIWLPVWLYLTYDVDRDTCAGFCALATGVMSYMVLHAALMVTAIVLTAQLLLLIRHDRTLHSNP